LRLDKGYFFNKNFATAQEFYDFCVAHHACADGLAEIKGRTLADWRAARSEPFFHNAT